MRRRSKQPPAPTGAPDWLVTYGDAMTLLLCFFVIIVSMSEVRQQRKFQQVIESLRTTFGGHSGYTRTLPTEEEVTNTLIKRLRELEPKTHTEKPSVSDEEGVEGRRFRVTDVRKGIEVVVGGKVSFDRFSAALKPEARQLLAQTAEIIRGYNTLVVVRGHATPEPLPPDSLYRDQRDLSYERAKAVAEELSRHGVRPDRLMLIALGDSQPLRKQAYNEDRLAENRRVEIIITENLLDDHTGTTFDEERQEQDDGN